MIQHHTAIEAALVGLEEAIDRRAERQRIRRAIGPIETAMTLALAKVFRQQGKLWRAKVGELRESDAEEQARMLAAWTAVAKATRKAFTTPIVAGIDQAFGKGEGAIDAGGGKKPPRAALPYEPTPVGPSVGLVWDARDSRAAAYLDEHVGQLIKGIESTTKERIGELITQGVAAGDSPGAIANRITDEFEGMAVARPQLHTQTRAMLIAATEVGQGYSAGKIAGARELASRGASLEKSWLTVGDGRVEQECQDNEAEGWIPLDQDFSSGDDRPLAHPACRCSLMVRSVRGGDEEEED